MMRGRRNLRDYFIQLFSAVCSFIKLQQSLDRLPCKIQIKIQLFLTWRTLDQVRALSSRQWKTNGLSCYNFLYKKLSPKMVNLFIVAGHIIYAIAALKSFHLLTSSFLDGTYYLFPKDYLLPCHSSICFTSRICKSTMKINLNFPVIVLV